MSSTPPTPRPEMSSPGGAGGSSSSQSHRRRSVQHLRGASTASGGADYQRQNLSRGPSGLGNKASSGVRERWTVYDFTQNLVSVLNDPNPSARKRDLTLFTKTYGEGFTKPPIPTMKGGKKVKLKYFHEYIENNQRSYANLKRNLDTCGATLELLGASDQEESVLGRRTSQEKRKETSNSILVALKDVPQVFFRSDFSLTDPSDFEMVLKIKELEEEPFDERSRGKIQHQGKLQEEFGHYLDLVEVQLSKQISLRSESFFSALSVQQDLHRDVKGILSEVLHIRHRLSIVNQASCVQPLKVAQLKRKRQNHMAVYRKLKLVATVKQTQPTIEMLISTSDFVGALDLINTTQKVLEAELKGIHCVKHLGPQLEQLESDITKMMSSDFIRSVMHLIAEESRGSQNGKDSPDSIRDGGRDKLAPIIVGLIRKKKLSFLDTYRDEVAKLIKARVKDTVRVYIVSSSEKMKSDGEDSAGRAIGGGKDKPNFSLAEQIRNMGFRDWALLLQGLFNSLTEVIRALQGINEMVVDIAVSVLQKDINGGDGEVGEEGAGVKSLNGCISEDEYTKLKKECDDILFSATELSHSRVAKLFTVKEEQTQKLVLPDFVRLYKITDEFIAECERLCGRQCHGLRGSLLSQSKIFLDKFHKDRMSHMGVLLDSERWKQTEVLSAFQDICENIIRRGTSYSNVQDDVQNGVEPPKLPPRRKVNGDSPNETPSLVLIVCGKEFYVVQSLLMLLRMVSEYCDFLDDISVVTPGILTRLVDLLLLYNTRTRQLILGAGAMRLAGLKTITAKHLALSSQCLCVVLLIIPYLVNILKNYLPVKQHALLSSLNNIVKDYEHHRKEIFTKLVSIMEDLFKRHLVNVKKWDEPNTGEHASAYVESVSKETHKLYKALVDLIQPEHLQVIFIDVFKSYSKLLVEFYGKLDLNNEVIKKKVQADVSALTEKMLKIIPIANGAEGFSELVQYAKQQCD